MNFCLEMKRVLIRYFPRELCRLLCSVKVPFKRRSYFSDYLRLWNVGTEEETESKERENDRRRRCLWCEVNAMLGYTLVLYFTLFGLDLAGERVENVAMWRLALCDIMHHMLTKDPETKLAIALLVAMAIYFNYRTYKKVEIKFFLLFDRLVFCRAGWRGFFPASRYLGIKIEQLVRLVPLAIVNVFHLFILLLDTTLIIIVLSKLVPFFFGEPQFNSEHSLGIIVSFALAANFVVQVESMLLYCHLCILQATIGMCTLFILYVRISQNQVALRQTWSIESIARFERYDVGSIQVFAVMNRAIANIFLAFLLCNAPVNVYVMNLITLNRTNLSKGSELGVYTFIVHQVLAIFCFHFFFAQISKRFHRSGRLLLELFARNQLVGSRRRVCAPRFALRVSLLIARLHVKRRYGILYGRIALVSMPLFVKVSVFWDVFHSRIRRILDVYEPTNTSPSLTNTL